MRPLRATYSQVKASWVKGEAEVQEELEGFAELAFAVAGSVASFLRRCVRASARFSLWMRRGYSDTQRLGSRLPRFWQLFPLILPRKVRREVYEPACEELKQDHIEAQRLATTPWARRWLTFAFTVRTIGLVLGSLHAAVGDRVMGFICKLMGEATKRLLGG
jgi:hypothetical protein